MRTPEEDAECRRLEQQFEELLLKVNRQVEWQARAGCSNVLLAVEDVRQLLHALSISPFKARTPEESAVELNARRRQRSQEPGHACNRGFWDLPTEARSQAMERACERGGVDNFSDLSPEERGRAYGKATGHEE